MCGLGVFFPLYSFHINMSENHFYANWNDGGKSHSYLQKLWLHPHSNVFIWKNHFPIKTVSWCGWPSFRVDHIFFSTKRYECDHLSHRTVRKTLSMFKPLQNGLQFFFLVARAILLRAFFGTFFRFDSCQICRKFTPIAIKTIWIINSFFFSLCL